MQQDHEPVGFVVASVGQQARAAFLARLEPYDLHPRGYGVLWALQRFGPSSQQRLAEAVELPASRMVALLAELAQRGYVRRRTDPADRRVQRVSLTAAGEELMQNLRVEAAEVEATIVAGLSAVEQEQLRSLLGRLASNLGGSGGLRVW